MGDTGPVDTGFHTQVTLLAVAWTMLCLGTTLCLKKNFFPWWLKYFSTSCDLVLLTSVLNLANGPRSPLVIGYFLVLGIATLRMSLPLVRFATVGSLIAYVYLLGCAKWPSMIGKTDTDMSVPRYQQLIMLLGVALTGVILGQVVRCARTMANDYCRDLRTGEDEP